MASSPSNIPAKYEPPKYFPLYHKDLRDAFQGMNAATRGAYISLLIEQWHKKTIPYDDVEALAPIMGATSIAEARKAWERLRAKFRRTEDGLYQNPRLEEVRARVEREIETARANGKLGGRPKKGNPPVIPSVKPQDDPRVKPQVNQQANPQGNPPVYKEESTKEKKNVIPEILPKTERISPSPDHSENLYSETSNPSEARPTIVVDVNGWEVWNLLLNWITESGSSSPTTLSFLAKVFGADVINGRLELFVEQVGTAEWIGKHYSRLIDEAFDGVQMRRMPVRLLVKKNTIARAS